MGKKGKPPVAKKSPKTSPKTSPNTSPKSLPQTSPQKSKISSPQPSTFSPPTSAAQSRKSKINGKTNLKSSIKSNRDSMGKIAPSFMGVIDSTKERKTTSTKYDVQEIVKSTKEYKEEMYYILEPKKKKALRQLCISNVVLTIFILLLIGLEIFLLFWFVFHNREVLNVPIGDMDPMAYTCFNAKMLGDEQDHRCMYFKDKYPSSCKIVYCSSVILRVEKTDGRLRDGSYIDVYAIRPADEDTAEVMTPEYTPCRANAWCRDDFCEEPERDETGLGEFADEAPIDGEWKLFCDGGADLPCFKADDRKVFLGNHEIDCNPSACSNTGPFPPYDSVKFGIRACINPLPKFGGKPCWGDNAEAANDAIVAMRICESCNNAQMVRPWDNCTLNKETGKECTLSCGGETFYLPTSHNCTRNNGKIKTVAGYCFHGICAEYLPHASCVSAAKAHDHHH